jgi:hypothetical protein
MPDVCIDMRLGKHRGTPFARLQQGGRMRHEALALDTTPDEDVILELAIVEVPGQGYSWKLRTADGEVVEQSPLFASLHQCLTDARHSAALNPGTDPYLRRN